MYPPIASSTTAIRQIEDDGEPGSLGEGHAEYFDHMTPTETGDETVEEREPLRDPQQAVDYLREISPELRGCAILDSNGHVLAATGDDSGSWTDPARELLAAADAASGEEAAHVHVATGDGEVFAVRQGKLAAVAVAERFVLSSLMAFDLRAVLRELG